MTDQTRDIAVIGYGCRFADADDVEGFWNNLVAGRSSFKPIPRERWNHETFHSTHSRRNDKTYASSGAFMDDVSSFPAFHFGIAPRRVETMDPQHRMVLDTVRVALQDAGMEKNPSYDRRRVGTFLGVSTSEYEKLTTARSMALMMSDGDLGESGDAETLGRAVENVAPISAFSMTGILLNMAAANVAHHWDLKGPAYTVDAACASSLVAVHDGITNIRAGIVDVAIAGGVYINLLPSILVGFSRIGAISKTGVCRPFDERADGFVQGEGCGIVILKSLEKALEDGDRIHAVIRGSGINSDGATSGPMAPAVEGQADVIQRALDDANIDPKTIGYVECHGTATKVGDPVEVAALHQILAPTAEQPVHLGSVKAHIGHTMSAAGVAGLIHAILNVEHGIITPLPDCGTPNIELDLEARGFKVPTTPVDWKTKNHPRRASVSAFGFGGTNCHLIVEQAPKQAPASSDLAELVVVSAPNYELLATHATALAASLEANEFELSDVAFTMSAARKFEHRRLAIVASSTEELIEELRLAARKIQTAPPASILSSRTQVTPDGAGEFGNLTFMFPGQGAQRVGLLRGVYQRFSGFSSRLNALSDSVSDLLDRPLTHYLYPELASKPFDIEQAELELTATEICQPVMAALGLALSEWLQEDIGVSPSFCIGHSLGEFVAAAAGGLLDSAEVLRFVAKRGRIMADLKLEDFGAMAAIRADATRVSELLGGRPDVGIANLNYPLQTVVSGSTEAVQQFTEDAQATGVKATILRVSHAFHSSLLNTITADLNTEIAKLKFKTPHTSVVSAVSRGVYSAANAEAIFCQHATAAVDFMAAARFCHDAEAKSNMFLEVGSGTTLTRFVRGTLDDTSLTQSLGTREGNDELEFLKSLGALVVLGANLNFDFLGEGNILSLPATLLEQQSYWILRDKKAPLDIASQDNHKEPIVSHDSTKSTDSQADLVALFQQQNTILAEHARIMAIQTAMLTGGVMPPVDTTFNAAQAPQAPYVAQLPEPAVVVEEVEPSYDFEAIVREAIAEVSAFPKDALKPTQQLASDLGFDSLMFVDMGTALQRAMPELGAIPEDAFSVKTTIADVVEFVESAIEAETDEFEPDVESSEFLIDEELSRYVPALIARPLPTLPGDTAIDSKSLVALVGEKSKLASDLLLELKKRGVKGELVSGDSALPAGTTALFYLGTLGVHVDKKKLVDVLTPLRTRAVELHTTTGGKPEALVVISDTGFDALHSGKSPFQAGATGLAKALHREWSRTLVKAIDVDPKAQAMAASICDEIWSAADDVEVVYSKGERFVVALEEAPFHPKGAGILSNDVVLITGGTKGIGAKIAIELAKRSSPKLVIASRLPEKNLSAEAKKNLDQMKAAGSQVTYLEWDVTQPGTAKIVKALKGVTVLIHSAGLIRDKEIQNKSDEDFNAVVDVKVRGLLNVMAALPTKLKFLIAFSSWAGRFGNRGQSDYAAANATMGQLAKGYSNKTTQVKVIDWPAWETSDMAQSIPSSVRDTMRSHGVTFISDTDGIDAFFDEMGTQDGHKETLYGVDLPTEIRTLKTQWKVSTDSHPYLLDHVLRDKPVLPMAVAMDYIALISQNAIGAGPFEIRDLTLYRGIEVDTPVTLHLKADAKVNGDQFSDVEIKCQKGDEEFVAYGAEYFSGRTSMPEISVRKVNLKSPDSIEMSLEHFYSQSFHGPSMRVIEKIEEIGDTHMIGWVRASTPESMINEPARQEWTIDPMVVDGAFQLMLFGLQTTAAKAAYPTGFESYVQTAPFGPGPIRVTYVIHEISDSAASASILFENESGELVATLSNLQNRLLDLALLNTSDSGPDIAEEHWKIDAFPEVEALLQRLEMAKIVGLRNPYFHTHDGVAKNTAIMDGREMINFSSYNYLGFSGSEEVSSASKAAIDHYGTSVSASRVASGQIPIHKEFEEELADFAGVDAALIFSAGHHTNESVIGHVFNEGDLILHDSLIHNSILTGAALSGAKRMAFPHNDYVALEKILKTLRTSYNKVGIMIEGVYSMDGDIPDLPRFIALKKKYKSLLYVDEAHSVGVIGSRGAGIANYFDIDPREVDIYMGTLSKSFSSCGGYIAGSKNLIEYLKYTVPGFIFSAGISPANCAAALAALRMLTARPDVPQLLQARSAFFLEACKERGIDTGLSKDSAVIPCIVGNSMECMQLSERLAERGINVQPIVYPAVDDDASRLRFFLSATHTEEQLLTTADAIIEELNAIQSGAAAE